MNWLENKVTNCYGKKITLESAVNLCMLNEQSERSKKELRREERFLPFKVNAVQTVMVHTPLIETYVLHLTNGAITRVGLIFFPSAAGQVNNEHNSNIQAARLTVTDTILMQISLAHISPEHRTSAE